MPQKPLPTDITSAPKTLEEAAKTVPEDVLRNLIRDELDKKEAERQEACNHGRSAQLLDASTGDIQCDDCGKVFNYATSGSGAVEVPERMQQNLDKLLERRREEKEKS